MKIILTGASGFIGSHLYRTLTDGKHELYCIDIADPSENRKGIFKRGDIYDFDWNEIIGWKPDVLIHLAGPASVRQSFDDMYSETKNSLLLTSFLLEKLRQKPDTKFLYFSSAAVYGNHPVKRYHESLPCNPVSPYGICKLATEQMVRIAGKTFGIDFAIVRPFSLYGPGLKKQVIYDLTMRFIKKENPLVIQSTGKENRDFVHVVDCCSIVSELLKRDLWGGLLLNIGSGKDISLKTLVRLIAKITNSKINYIFAGKDRLGNPINLVADVTKLNELGLSCSIRLEDGLRDTIKILRN